MKIEYLTYAALALSVASIIATAVSVAWRKRIVEKEVTEIIARMMGGKMPAPKPKRDPYIDPSDCELNHQINRGNG